MDVDNTDKNTHVMLLVVICIKVLKICHSYLKKNRKHRYSGITIGKILPEGRGLHTPLTSLTLSPSSHPGRAADASLFSGDVHNGFTSS